MQRKKLKHLDLFSGIGGFALAARWAGMQTIAFCEIEAYPQKVLRKNFPGIPIFDDIRNLHAKDLPERPDVITGGYPCQPFSLAGKRRGENDDRHLWPEMLRLIRECSPGWVIGENVKGHVSMGLDQVLADLENEDYSCWPVIIPACAVGARHIRERVWIIANSNKTRLQELKRPEEEQEGARSDRSAMPDNWRGWNPRSSFLCRGDDGIPHRVDRIKGLGNAIVPQLAYEILRCIRAV
jgi:DNA (cytosine-5)-methyltransferase 1